MAKFRLKKIRQKLALAFGALMALSLFVSAWNLVSVQVIRKFHENDIETIRINSLLQEMRKNEKEFLNTEIKTPSFYVAKHTPISDSLESLYKEINTPINQLKATDDQETTQLQHPLLRLEKHTKSYMRYFRKMVGQSLSRGYRDYGKVGELRKAIHRVEKMPYSYDQVAMLTLRRHEKDFLLRKDLKYAKRFKNVIKTFSNDLRQRLNTANLPPDSVDMVMGWVEAYRQNFRDVVSEESVIGLHANDGLRARLAESAGRAEVAADEVLKYRQEAQQKEQKTITSAFIILFMAQLVAGVWMVYFFSKKFSLRIRQIKYQSTELARGKVPEPSPVKDQDELGVATQALNQLVKTFENYIAFARLVGNGELDSKFKKLSDEDALGAALLDMRQDLKKVQEAERIRKSVLDGLSEFAELIRNEKDDLYKQFMRAMVKKLGAVQGSIFLLDKDEVGQQVLRMEACYAWERHRLFDKDIYPGDGIAGQVFLEKRQAILNVVPPDYFQIRSGLGGELPSNLIILPLIADERCCGVMEIASFQPFKDHEVELSEKAGAALASAFLTRKNHQQVQQLYSESREQTRELKEKEEVMRQNNEELLATQEEMKRKEREYIKRIDELKEILSYTSATGELPTIAAEPAKAPG